MNRNKPSCYKEKYVFCIHPRYCLELKHSSFLDRLLFWPIFILTGKAEIGCKYYKSCKK